MQINLRRVSVKETGLQELVQLLLCLGHFFDFGIVNGPTVGHNHGKTAKGGQVLQRIGAADNEISALARFNAAGDLVQTGNPGIAQGCGVQGKGRGYAAVFVEVVHFPPHIVVGDIGAACVGTQANGNAVGKTGLGAVQNAAEYQELICKGWFLPPNTYDCGSFVVNGIAVIGKESKYLNNG